MPEASGPPVTNDAVLATPLGPAKATESGKRARRVLHLFAGRHVAGLKAARAGNGDGRH